MQTAQSQAGGTGDGILVIIDDEFVDPISVPLPESGAEIDGKKLDDVDAMDAIDEESGGSPSTLKPSDAGVKDEETDGEVADQ